MIHTQYKVTGHLIDVTYTEKEVNEIFKPLLEKLVMFRKEKNARVIVYLAAPPGAGKTILSLFLEDLYKEQGYPYTFQSIAMDGFHHDNDYLNQHTVIRNGREDLLKKYKGIPESFNLTALKEKIEALTQHQHVNWPTYDRALHDVSKETISVNADIVLIEGNYLLLEKEGWNELTEYCDYTLFIQTGLSNIEDRLIDRKQLGGATPAEAVNHYEQTDKINAELVLSHSAKADLTLELTSDGQLKEI
ncbi:nucleoside/nucleotide kinase family protein [Alkalibacterium sp. f15]|uniref:nucleoside/nucleotide kinase family protein n=1 Tax=Alkalibacterium sp. f15 TaxID=3414029 RepID=UPI003BF7F08F